jgi:hypothetical protein
VYQIRGCREVNSICALPKKRINIDGKARKWVAGSGDGAEYGLRGRGWERGNAETQSECGASLVKEG